MERVIGSGVSILLMMKGIESERGSTKKGRVPSSVVSIFVWGLVSSKLFMSDVLVYSGEFTHHQAKGHSRSMSLKGRLVSCQE